MNTIRIHLKRYQMDGQHIANNAIATLEESTIDLPLAECSSPCPHLGEYKPIVNTRAIEKALRHHGHIYPIARDQQWTYGLA